LEQLKGGLRLIGERLLRFSLPGFLPFPAQQLLADFYF